jgi:hypothetical protein
MKLVYPEKTTDLSQVTDGGGSIVIMETSEDGTDMDYVWTRNEGKYLVS